MTRAKQLIRLMAALVSLPALWLLATSIASAGGIPAQETGLNPTGTLYELNADARGNLWISDYGADEVWQVNPATNVYTIYQGMTNATDARMKAKEEVWWLDNVNRNLGRIALLSSTLTTWALPGTSPMALAFDDAGRVWVTDFFQVHRFTPGTTEVCTYDVPDSGYSVSIAAHAGEIWLGDDQQERILKLDPGSNVLTSWQLTPGAFPRGLAVEENGNLWWADEDLRALTRLEPGSNRLTAYTLPDGASPKMIALSAGKVWYTSRISGTVGVLDPARASGITSTLTVATTPVTPTCSILGPGISSSVTISSGIVTWAPTIYTRTIDSAGWVAFQMPPNASPWGIAAANGRVWVGDQGRQKLAWLSELYNRTYLPLVLR